MKITSTNIAKPTTIIWNGKEEIFYDEMKGKIVSYYIKENEFNGLKFDEFGVKFGNQKAIKQFIEHGFPGTYVRVLEEGFVKTSDTFKLLKKAENSITTAQFFKLLFSKEKDKNLIRLILDNDALPERKRDKLKQFI